MLLLQCKNCGNRMKYQSRTTIIADRSKQCVYCGKSFKIRAAILKKVSQ